MIFHIVSYLFFFSGWLDHMSLIWWTLISSEAVLLKNKQTTEIKD